MPEGLQLKWGWLAIIPHKILALGSELAFHQPKSLPFTLPCHSPSHYDTISPTLKGVTLLMVTGNCS